MKKKSTIKIPFPELLYPYSPVAKPMPPLTITEVCQSPRVQVEFNCELVPYLLGLLEIYRYKDSFSGTDEQKTISVGVMRQLMEELAMAGCGCDDDKVIIKRINPETGQVEISEDDGATWTTDPQSPYVLATIATPLTGPDGDVKRCEAANNVVEHLKDMQGGFSEKIGLVNGVADMAVAIIVIALGILFLPFVGAALLAVISPFIAKLFEVARFLSNTTQGQYDALFTEANWTLTRCILYCHVSDNGSFSQSAWSSVKSDMKAQMGAGIQEAGANLAAMVDVWGLVGLNNAARIGSGAEGNCDDCDCVETCGFKYEIWQRVGFPVDAYGIIVDQTDTYVDVQFTSTHITLKATNINDCCYVTAIQALSGGGFGSGFLQCGQDFTGAFTPATPIGQCASYIECQSGNGGVVRISLDVCP